jgi:hypothetical protein
MPIEFTEDKTSLPTAADRFIDREMKPPTGGRTRKTYRNSEDGSPDA